MRELRADQTRLSFREDEIAIDFGELTGPDETGALEVILSQRVRMAPTTAARLLYGLRSALRTIASQTPPDARSGAAPEPVSPRMPLEALLDPTSQLESSRAEPTPSGALAADLFATVRGLGVTYGHERSFRMRRGELLSNRFLLTVDREGLGRDAEALVRKTWSHLRMPPELLADAEGHLDGARSFHFGFEGDSERPLLKVYVESAEALDAAERAEPGADPFLLHIAYKWDPTDPKRSVTSRYLLHPAMTLDAIRARLGAMYEPSGARESLEIATGVLELASGRMPERDIQFLEVVEEGNERRSYDLNLYDAGLLVRDLHAPLARMRRHLEIPPGRFQALYDQIKSRRFGHLAGGVHRDGGDFFTVYHGGVFVREGAWRSAATAPAGG